jgi:hypothetical protein
VLRDTIAGYWIGQLAGNDLGFPFANVYVEEPVRVPVDRYSTAMDAGGRKIVENGREFRVVMVDFGPQE